jgi:ribonuclease T2
MKPAISIAIFALLLPLAACKSTPLSTASGTKPAAQNSAVPIGSGFDYYLLNLSWSPEFCYSHRDAAECAAHHTFVLHGLWPQNFDGTYPENCSNAPGPADPSSFSDIYPDADLLQHEWKTHGTCSGINADAIFTTARTADRSIAIPQKLESLTRQASMSPNEIVSLFIDANPRIPRESLAVSCGNNYLTAVEICYDKTLRPVQCGPIRSCRAVVIRVPPPG